ncbi:restriction endonuclease [Oceanospirillum beijerinckii]|uniref:restriction endonuclease n=1 Tax=Oceanospirillum beijerinckii TaxID=64976 RepID=UPI000483EE8E|nr:restriction endonuclease [Oceanospirillum beijerinckii]
MSNLDLDSISEDPFSQMTWKEFEDYVIDLLSCYYSKDGLKMHKTQYVNDGGKDGYASFIIGPQGYSEFSGDLSHETLFWAEVKKRTKASVNESDIGGHVILALDKYVHKLIFVTNGFFTQRAKNTCLKVGRRLNMSVSFIDGNALIELARNQHSLISPVPYKVKLSYLEKQSSIYIKTGFVAQQYDEIVSDSTLTIGVGEIVFWVCEVSGSCSNGDIYVKPIAKPSDNHFFSINCLSKGKVNIDATDSTHRVVFSVCITSPGKYSCNDILSYLDISRDITVNHAPSNSQLRVRQSILSNELPVEREQIVNSISSDFKILSDEGGVRGCLLEAGGGIGKSFIVNKVRQKILNRSITEMYLDGAKHRTAINVTQAIVQQSLPIPQDISNNIDPAILKEWMSTEDTRAFFHDYPASGLLSIMRENNGQYSDIKHIVSALSSTLSKLSNKSPVFIVFEDLHKVNPSVLSFLEDLFSQLSVRSQGRVYFLFSTRPNSFGKKEEQEKWFEALGRFCDNQDALQYNYISSLKRNDAIALPTKSIRGLSDIEAVSIIEQVGTNPFNLKEALLYLRHLDVIINKDGVGSFISDSLGIKKAINNRVLQGASKKRLELIIKTHGELLRDFLLSCACLGKFFSLDIALSIFQKESDYKLNKLIEICEKSEIFRFSNLVHLIGNENCAFDHDIIRLAVFQSMPIFPIMNIAKRLIDKIDSVEKTDLIFRLSYLANKPSLCLGTLESLIKTSEENRRYQEALEYSLVRAAILLNTSKFFGKSDFLVPYIEKLDDSLGFVEIPKERQSTSKLQLLDTIVSPLKYMDKIGVFPDELSNRLITLGAMNSERYIETNHKSLFKFYEGRLKFGQSDYNTAMVLFKEAEKYWPKSKGLRSKSLSDIRMRIAICERHLGRLDNARIEMSRALSLRNGADWELFEEVAASLGAIYMYSDQDQARRYWNKGLKVARRIGNQHQIAHFLNDIGHLDIMEEFYDQAENNINSALTIAENHGVTKEIIRSDIFYGCINIAKDKTDRAIASLTRAENEAFIQHNLRRLWRIRANLATVAELEGRMEDAYIKDRQSLVHMPIENELEKVNGKFKHRTRVSGALVNIFFRSNKSPELYKDIINLIGNEAWNYAENLHNILYLDPGDHNNQLGGITCLYKNIGSRDIYRFLLTE